ncbi:sulfotransferase [Phaeobacter gallaeciensis]|uniref:sulfotransferase family protein n=1 Tax=Phaeobacter gallaeciensis TaxID=60890 RepID=UPI00237F4403|nr:sulfotransferase [Phaeobacter gallaeciensis]MDE4306149.1 sulfotransferase [Phaeobacter gallaeciensis]MDE4310571.1 sulfotransferase [Phaeobacter gallaeciensis]MDE4315031.1 sulfotransferase [Phaeobacter gallaeciensis]MDE4319492.1 sulfotransferase [Phaeobacter gallaeciensis]MDE4323872.1 sulfotransferase [Phaeobacter gallaeciensis]
MAGPPKGGTTWLMRLLDAHPEAACSGEGHYFDRLRPMLLKVFEEYQRILSLDAKLVFSGKPVLAPVRHRNIDSMLRHFILERFAEYAPDLQIKAHGDKTPHNWKDMKALFAAFPEATLIFINRDPRDAAVSLFGHARRRQLQGMDPEGPLDRDKLIRVACGNWVGVNRALAQIQAERPANVISLTYENLLEDTEGEYARVCKHLGLSCDPQILTQAIADCSFSKMSGREQGKRDLSSFFTSGTSGSWRNELSQDEAFLATSLCGDLLEGAGYMR